MYKTLQSKNIPGKNPIQILIGSCPRSYWILFRILYIGFYRLLRVLSRIFHLGEKSVCVAKGQEYSRGVGIVLEMDMCWDAIWKYLWFWDTTVSDLNDHNFFFGGEGKLGCLGGKLLKPSRYNPATIQDPVGSYCIRCCTGCCEGSYKILNRI